MADRAAGRDCLGGSNDRIRIDAVVAVEVANFSGLTEVLHAERTHAMAAHGAQPREGCRMPVEHRDDAAVRRYLGEEPLDVGTGMHEPALARPARGGPAGVEAVGGGYGGKADIAAGLRPPPAR